MTDFRRLPSGLPIPQDDGACRHLTDLPWPALELVGTDGTRHDLSALPGRTVLYIYPMTARPGAALPDDWDLIPGARGCTPQSCAFRDHHAELEAAGARVFGLSVQSSEDQREAAVRLHLPFILLSDAELRLAAALNLPTFRAGGRTLLRRLTLILNGGRIDQVFYPVFPPDQNAAEVLKWLAAHP